MNEPIVIVLREPAATRQKPTEAEPDFWILALACVGAWMIGRWVGQALAGGVVPEAFREAFRE